MAASPREPDEDGLRITVGLKRLVLRRTDGAEEDDFKTWALAQLVTCDGRPWDELWYGRAAAEDGSDANLAKTSVTNGFEAAYNYKRRSKPVDIKHIAERLPGARMEVTVFKGAARDPSADTPIGHASLLLAPLASGRPIERRLQLLPPPAPAAASASGAATPSPGGSPSKGAKAAAAPAPAAEAAASAAPAAEYEGAVRVRVEADARLGAALAGGRFLRLTSASLSGVPFRWTPPGGDVGDERPVIADAAEEAALDEAGHEARAAACAAAGEAGGARYALVMSLEGLRGEAPSKGRAAGSGSGLGSVYAPAAEAEAARTAAQTAARRLAGWAEGPGGDVIRGDDVPEDAAEAAKAAAEAAAAEAAERAQAGGGWALALGGGGVVYRRTGGSDPAAAAASADADVDADADADAAGAAAGSGAATPRSGAGAPDSEPAAPAGAWAWGVEWKDLGSGPTGGRIFLSADDVAALRARTAAGGRAVVGLRRVMAEPVEDPAVAAALPADAEFGLPRGWLPAQEDVDGRGLAELDLSALLKESVTECEVGAALQGRVPTEAEAEAAEEAAAARADRWAEAEEAAEAAIAAASGGAAAAGGKKKGGSAKDKKKASSAKDKKKASSAKDKKKAGSAKDKKKGGAAGKKGAAEEEEAEEPPPKPVLDQAASSIAIRLELDRALVEPPPPAPTPVRRAADLVPTRPPPPRGDVGLGATAEFRRDVVLAAHAIAEQYAAVAHSAGAGRGSGSSPDDRRRALLAELNESGVYLALKERLRKAAVRIVRERFRDAPRAASAGDVGSGDVSGEVSGTGSLLPPQREAFVSQLFVFLSGQVSRALNAAFDAADAAAAAAAAPAAASGAAGGARGGAGRGLPGAPSLSGAAGSPSDAVSDATAALASQLATFGDGVSALLDEPDPSNALAAMTGSAVPAAVEPEDARLGRLAEEAEFRGDVATAERFHQDRVARMEEAALHEGGAFTTDVWCAYAEWLCRRGQLSKAEAAAREAVAIDPGCVRALCLLAAVAAERGQALAAGETFARDAVSASRRQQEEAWAALASACSGGAVPGYGAGVPGAMAGSAEPASAEEAGASLGGPGMPGADEDGDEDEDEDDGGDEAGSAGRMQDGGGDAALLTSSEALFLVADLGGGGYGLPAAGAVA
ncbi:hypothetical protein FNF29_05466 [Cafeteria roenbergensis]|uniref:Uncharacterized protein n=1 Tax=Cafeteria roenbergensis TaxID=33653 RepID=A0A5A8CAT8_CAFRO|nr:hypothetical protein FNF29_05466 [Cafeteria roenbergensis]|eukprot:KAA0150226.1 hypothetical protein FNF29_05466 [Cafeteria roenbergensis]